MEGLACTCSGLEAYHNAADSEADAATFPSRFSTHICCVCVLLISCMDPVHKSHLVPHIYILIIALTRKFKLEIFHHAAEMFDKELPDQDTLKINLTMSPPCTICHLNYKGEAKGHLYYA